MRFRVDIKTNKSFIQKDKNRIILSFLKECLEKNNEQKFKELYGKGNIKRKNLTFSIFMPNCIFHRDEIEIPQKNIHLYISTSEIELGCLYYNTIFKERMKPYVYRNNLTLEVQELKMIAEPVFKKEIAIFKTMSPIVIRKHINNNYDYFYSLTDLKGQCQFLNNLKNQLYFSLSENYNQDIATIDFQVLKNKIVKVKHYNRIVHANISTLKIIAIPDILQHIYSTGIGSMKSSGFGMLENVEV